MNEKDHKSHLRRRNEFLASRRKKMSERKELNAERGFTIGSEFFPSFYFLISACENIFPLSLTLPLNTITVAVKRIRDYLEQP